MSRHNSANVWFEPAPTVGAATDTPIASWLQLSGSDWVIAQSGPNDGAFIDWRGVGICDLLNTKTPGVIIDDGAGGLLLASSGTAKAILVDDGSGGIAISTNLTLTPAADLYLDGSGAYVVSARTATRAGLVFTGSVILSYT